MKPSMWTPVALSNTVQSSFLTSTTMFRVRLKVKTTLMHPSKNIAFHREVNPFERFCSTIGPLILHTVHLEDVMAISGYLKCPVCLPCLQQQWCHVIQHKQVSGLPLECSLAEFDGHIKLETVQVFLDLRQRRGQNAHIGT